MSTLVVISIVVVALGWSFHIWHAVDPLEEYCSGRGFSYNGLCIRGVVEGFPFDLTWYGDDDTLLPVPDKWTRISVPLGTAVPAGLYVSEESFGRTLAKMVGMRDISIPNIPVLDQHFIVKGKSPRDVQDWATLPEVEKTLTELTSRYRRIELRDGDLDIHIKEEVREPAKLDELISRVVGYTQILGGTEDSFPADWTRKPKANII